MTWKEFHRPHMQMSMIMGTGDPFAGSDRSSFMQTGNAAPVKTQNIDYEQYVIRSPLREAGPNFVEGRQNPTMTYLSRKQINSVNSYIEFGWIWDVPEPSMPRMRHDNYDERAVIRTILRIWEGHFTSAWEMTPLNWTHAIASIFPEKWTMGLLSGRKSAGL